MTYKTKLHIALPVLNELDYINNFLECVRNQTYKNFELYICVNQPEKWWDDNDEKKYICSNNSKTIRLLEAIKDLPITIIDRSSRKLGWQGRRHGVGWARKNIMDYIEKVAYISDIIVSLDADTTFSNNYFSSIVETFSENPTAVALSVPYYHNLVEDENANRAILRYEIYMRYYAINLWRIKSPYSFTALGSAFALPMRSYRALGGLTPKISGEDFYFLQKLRKYGNLLNWNAEKVYPGTRFSDRVYFGTGPAMIKGNAGDWESYPIYDFNDFNIIKETYDLFPALFKENVETPMDDFLTSIFKEENIWDSLRLNNKIEEKFVKACHEKIDSLRVLQFLKEKNNSAKKSDEKKLFDFMQKFYKTKTPDFLNKDFLFDKASVEELNSLRDLLVIIEEEYQKESINF
ncbi:MAG: glycosyltransferase [Saprospiraceae bacterium]|nr:glycosyltransferase [Saprospiraceae bacterium]